MEIVDFCQYSNRARDTLDPIATIFASFNSFNFLLSDFRVISRQSGCKVFKYIFSTFSFVSSGFPRFVYLSRYIECRRSRNYSRIFSPSFHTCSLTKQFSPNNNSTKRDYFNKEKKEKRVFLFSSLELSGTSSCVLKTLVVFFLSKKL